jgi:predicted transcriptional regulator
MSNAVKDAQVTLRVSTELKDRIETYAQLTGRSKSHVAMEAIAAYLDWRTPQIADLKDAIAAADNGDFADDAEVSAVLARYAGAKARASLRRA